MALALASLASAGEDRARRDRRWRTATAAFEDGLYDVSANELQKFLRAAEDEKSETARAADAVALLARAMLAQGKGKEMLEYLRENRRWFRRIAPGAIPFWRAQAFYDMGNLPAAMGELRNFADNYPSTPYVPRALRLSAWCRLQGGETNAALQAFAEFDRAYTDTVESAVNRLEWGHALIVAGQMDEAEKVLAPLTTMKADADTRAKGQYWRARVLLEQARWKDAVALLDLLVTQTIPDRDVRAEVWFALARARSGLGDERGAAAALNRGLEYARRKDLILSGSQRLGLLYLDLGRLDEGVSLLRQTIANMPSDPHAGDSQLAVAGALLDNGRAADAIAAYQYYLESFTNTLGVAQAYKGRGWALQAAGRYAEAAASFEQATSVFTNAEDRQDCMYKAGDAYFANQRYKVAAQSYERLLAEYPDSPHAAGAMYQLGQSLMMGQEPSRAIEVFRQVAQRYPTDPLAEEALLRIAQVWEAQDRPADAESAYTAVMDAYPKGVFTPDALRGRGVVRQRLGRVADALADYQALADGWGQSPQAEEARYQMILCQYLLGRDDLALNAAHGFLADYPRSSFAPRAQYWLGKYTFNAGQYAEAEKAFLSFYASHPKDPDAERALLWAARAAARGEEYLRANEILARLMKAFPNGTRVAEARLDQANVLIALAKFPEAILALQEIINRFPQSDLVPDAWLRLGDCQFMLGADDAMRYAAASTAFRAAASHPNARVDLMLQAEYKIGRCLQKMDRPDEAMRQYYKNVIVRYQEVRDGGAAPGEAARTWVGRAARDTADILEERKEWQKVVSVLERALNAGVADDTGIRDRIQTIRAQHWWLFY